MYRKKITVAILSLLTMMLLLTSAYAASEISVVNDDGEIVCNDKNIGSFTVTYSKAVSGEQYALLVVKEGTSVANISADNLLYIDQQAASNGKVAFTFIPKELESCDVLLGGEFASGTSPITLGEIEVEEALAAPSITVSLNSNSKPVIKWAKVSGADKYELWYAEKGGSYSKLITTTSTSVANNSAVAGKTYSYKVKAICASDSSKNSAYSAVKSITVK